MESIEHFVTALVYKNLRVVRTKNPNEHPIFVGPIFIHRDVKKNSKEEGTNYVVSSYSNFSVPALKVAKTPGQKSRLRSNKTSSKRSKNTIKSSNVSSKNKNSKKKVMFKQ